MNAKTMSAILEHMDAKSVRICMLDEKLRKADEMFRQWKTLLGLDAKLTGPEVEEAIKRMNFDRSTLQTNYQQHVQLQRALDSLVDLPRLTDESYSAYAYRVGRVLADRTGRGTELAALADKRLNDLAELHIKLAKLETRESELIALHDAIEYLSGFPMQPQESYAAYLQRLAAANKLNAERATAMDGHLQAIEKAILKADAFRKLPKESFAEYVTRLAADRARLAADLEHLTASTQATTQRLRAQLDGNNQQYAESRATIANLESQLAEASKERDNFRARWEESLAERDRAVNEARRTSEANQAMQGDITMHRAVLSRILMEKGASQLLHGMEWNDAARKVLFEAGAMVGDTGKPSA